MTPYIIMIVSLLLDGLLSNYLPYLANNLSIFTPLLTVISVFIIFPFYRKDTKKYLITVFILGFIYDMLYTNLLFFNAVLFFILAFINMKIQKRVTANPFSLCIESIIMIVVYESLTGILLFTFNMVPISFYKVYYKIIHSLLLNIIYTELLYFIVKSLPKKYKEISIN